MPAIQCALRLFHSFTNETAKINFQFLQFISRCNSYTKHGKCVLNGTNFAFYTIKMRAQEYVSEVGKKTVLSGQPY